MTKERAWGLLSNALDSEARGVDCKATKGGMDSIGETARHNPINIINVVLSQCMNFTNFEGGNMLLGERIRTSKTVFSFGPKECFTQGPSMDNRQGQTPRCCQKNLSLTFLTPSRDADTDYPDPGISRVQAVIRLEVFP